MRENDTYPYRNSIQDNACTEQSQAEGFTASGLCRGGRAGRKGSERRRHTQKSTTGPQKHVSPVRKEEGEGPPCPMCAGRAAERSIDNLNMA
ncbi:hypothetical protein C8R44DRAFT_819480 [Mycena epipterygia]|nr:hypothetical protein C8R44DRAFT_819480 [Mycena epipterygia]